jgi:hypothetical protein
MPRASSKSSTGAKSTGGNSSVSSEPETEPGLRKITVVNFEDNGIVYCKDDNGIVYDTEDVVFDIRPARAIGTFVDGHFEPYTKAIDSDSSPLVAKQMISSDSEASDAASS